jgi:photosystem II stability/assembly factor-like uncharacterized protein
VFRTSLVAVSTVVGMTLSAPTWTPQLTGVNARLRGVSAVTDKVVWVSGTGGTVLRTTDGGDTWKQVPVPNAAKLDFRDIDGLSDKVAYVLSIGNGELSRIYKTIDGGVSWTAQLANTDPKVFLDAMAFWSSERGIAYSDSIEGQFVIFRTTDGRTWHRIPAAALPPALPNEGAYAASGTNVTVQGKNDVWIGTTASRVLHSADGGNTWSVAQTPMATGAAAGIFSVAFRDPLHGIAVGGDYEKELEAVDNAAVTSDGGKSWTLSKGLTGYRSVVAYVPRSKSSWIAVGPRGADITHDDGKTWLPVGGAGLDTFSFPPRGKVGWGAGGRGSVGRLDGLLQ